MTANIQHHATGPDVLEREVPATLPQVAGGTVDVQIATARHYPRSITTFIRRAAEMATLTPEIAASCVYAVPRGGKTIEGPSARLAEIVAHAWGNLRIQAGATDHDDRYITGRGEAWDVESNVAIGFEVRRRITDSHGRPYNDDMIVVTGNAAASIALRNAVFKTVPSSYWRPIYAKCRQVIAGEARTFASRRDEMLKAFAVMGVTTERLCAAISVRGIADLTLDHMVTLTGFYNALKEGETTIEEAFPDGGGLGAPQPAQRKSQSQPRAESTASIQPTMATPAAASDEGAASAPTVNSLPPCVGKIVDILEKPSTQLNGKPGWIVRLDTGFVCGTRIAEIAAAGQRLRGTETVVELVTKPASDPRYAPTIEEIQIVEESATP